MLMKVCFVFAIIGCANVAGELKSWNFWDSWDNGDRATRPCHTNEGNTTGCIACFIEYLPNTKTYNKKCITDEKDLFMIGNPATYLNPKDAANKNKNGVYFDPDTGYIKKYCTTDYCNKGFRAMCIRDDHFEEGGGLGKKDAWCKSCYAAMITYKKNGKNITYLDQGCWDDVEDGVFYVRDIKAFGCLMNNGPPLCNTRNAYNKAMQESVK